MFYVRTEKYRNYIGMCFCKKSKQIFEAIHVNGEEFEQLVRHMKTQNFEDFTPDTLYVDTELCKVI